MSITFDQTFAAAADDAPVDVREATPAECAELFPEIDPERIGFALVAPRHRSGVVFSRDAFDSQQLGLEIGRIQAARAPSGGTYRALADAVMARARVDGFDQVLRRTSAASTGEIHALGAAGFELMDVGLTFARRLARGGPPAREWPDLRVALSTDADVEAIATEMVAEPWASRYEADPAYHPARVRQLRTTWLVNSHRGRAQAFFVGHLDGRPAGYATCLLHDGAAAGEIDLVGTLPAFRGRRVAARVIEHALAWLSARTPFVTVRTQATNIAAASLYERAGFTLHASDITFRAALRPLQGGLA